MKTNRENVSNNGYLPSVEGSKRSYDGSQSYNLDFSRFAPKMDYVLLVENPSERSYDRGFTPSGLFGLCKICGREESPVGCVNCLRYSFGNSMRKNSYN